MKATVTKAGAGMFPRSSSHPAYTGFSQRLCTAITGSCAPSKMLGISSRSGKRASRARWPNSGIKTGSSCVSVFAEWEAMHAQFLHVLIELALLVNVSSSAIAQMTAERSGMGGDTGAPTQSSNDQEGSRRDRKSTRLNSSHGYISYAVFCLKKKNRADR